MMGCCGSRRENKRYRLTDPQGEVHVYLTEPEARIAQAMHGGGIIEIIREKNKTGE